MALYTLFMKVLTVIGIIGVARKKERKFDLPRSSQEKKTLSKSGFFKMLSSGKSIKMNIRDFKQHTRPHYSHLKSRTEPSLFPSYIQTRE